MDIFDNVIWPYKRMLTRAKDFLPKNGQSIVLNSDLKKFLMEYEKLSVPCPTTIKNLI